MTDEAEAPDESGVIYDDEPVTTEEVEEVEQVEEEAEEEPEPEPEKARVEFTPEQQAKVNEIVSQTAKRYMEKLEQLQQAPQQTQEKSGKPPRPEIPPPPDPFEDDFVEKMSARDKAIQEAAQWDAVQRLVEIQEQQNQQAQQQQALEKLNNTINEYNKAAKKLGIKPDELKLAGHQVGAAELHADLVEYILTDDVGPAITTYLAENYGEIEKIKAMTPTRAAAYIASEIRPKAAARKKVKSAPPPPDRVKGGGFPEHEGGPEGATYL